VGIEVLNPRKSWEKKPNEKSILSLQSEKAPKGGKNPAIMFKKDCKK